MDPIPPQPKAPNFSPTPSLEGLWDKFRESPVFPVASIVIIAVIILGLGIAVVGLVNRFGTKSGVNLGPVKGPENVSYTVGGGAELKLSVSRAAYYDDYNGSKPLAPGRKLVVVNFEVRNEGGSPSGAFTNADMRLITPDGSIMAPGGWSAGFLNSGVGPGTTKKGEVVFDIDERNSQHPLSEFSIAFGQNPGSRATYPLK